jgi:arylsulfatase A-like enzyme
LRAEDVTVAEVLKRAGYATGLIGKWGLGPENTTGTPNRKGFDYFYGYLRQVHAHNDFPDLWKNEEKIPIAGNVVKKGIATQRSQYSPDLFTREALDFVQRNRDKPFFLYLAYTAPRNGMEVPSDATYSDRPWPQPVKDYAAMVTRLDADVGRLQKELKELGLDENTIVFFSSGNGPPKDSWFDPAFLNSAGPLRGTKSSLYEGGIRVPMIVRWPGKIRAGAVSDLLWAFWDFLPTAADLATAMVPSGLDGISCVSTLLGTGNQKKHELLYWEYNIEGLQQAIRMGDWKGIRRRPGDPLELYNLKEDIGEKTNVASRHPEVMAQIQDALRIARTNPPPPNNNAGSKRQ